MHVVDEPGSEEVADDGGASADPYVPTPRSRPGGLERLGRRPVDEVERRPALHRDGRTWVMGEDEDGRVERRVGAPPSLPVRVLVPSGVAELAGTHDLGADTGVVQPQEGVVDAAAPAGLADHLAPPAGGEHPLVQPLAGVAERCVEALRLTGA